MVRRVFSLGVVTLVFASALNECGAQQYTPREVYNGKSSALIEGLRQQLSAELKRLGPSKWDPNVVSQYNERTELLVRQIKKRAFIKDDSLDHFVGGVFDDLIKHNAMARIPVRVLILKSPVCNAYCVGEGTFVITVGLLARISNESELAFILAHEMAHYELDHVMKRSVQEAETKFLKTSKESVRKILTEDREEVTLSEMDSLRKLVYNFSRFAREHEVQADSLALLYLRKSGYNEGASLTALSALDSADYSKDHLGDKLLEPFRFSNYPILDYWLESAHIKPTEKPDRYFIFSRDSILSHPEMAMRRSLLSGAITGKRDIPLNLRDESYIEGAIELAEFERVEAAFKYGNADYVMLLALQVKISHNKSSYINGVISKILIRLVEANDNNVGAALLPPASPYYGIELKAINSFLRSLTRNEMAELAFHFLNNQTNFDGTVEEHYFLLWKICQLTDRKNLSEKVLGNYKSRFAKGKYTSQMHW